MLITTDPPRCYALVPCAGVGLRAGVGGPKQYHRVAGRTVVAHTLAALAGVSRLSSTLVVLSPDDTQFDAAVADLPAPAHQTRHVARCGGGSRADKLLQCIAVDTSPPVRFPTR